MSHLGVVGGVRTGAVSTSDLILGLGVGSALSLVVMLLLWLQKMTGGRHGLPLLFLSAHLLALALAFAPALLNPPNPSATPALLMALSPGVGGNARVGVEDGEVGVPAAVVLIASTASFLRLALLAR